MIVVADTTPLHYLILIRQENVLERLFGRVLVPPAVAAELVDPATPQAVSSWMSQPPAWLQIQAPLSAPDRGLDHLDAGEREAITLALELRADQLLIDETDGRREASLRRLPFIGTFGVLRRASQLGLVELPAALTALQKTSFYVQPDLIRSLLEEDARRERPRFQNSLDADAE